jgi:hypothetical protein
MTNHLYRRLATRMIALAFVAAPLQAFAWGPTAHAVIDRAAIATLPSDGPVFLKSYSDYVAASATIPDIWRSPTEPFSKIEEDPNHGWFREQFAFMKTIPRSRYEFVLALYREYLRIKDSDPETARRTNVRWTGTLPYAAMETYGHLVAEMRMMRRMQAAGQDVRFLEQNCAFDVFRLGHYIGDGGQPLHDSVNSDGWRGPNPQGYTPDPSIHGRFETTYVDAIGLSTNDIIPRISKPGHLEGDLFQAVLAYLDASGGQMENVYQLDKRGAFGDPKSSEARKFIYDRTTAAASMLRDMIYRAWLEAALPPRVVKPDPLDPANPAYDAETGSAAAPVDQPHLNRGR